MLLWEMPLNTGFIVADGRCHCRAVDIPRVGGRTSFELMAKELNEFSRRLFALGAELLRDAASI